MKRVAVVGNTGAGKTTLAAELARRLGVPHVELDGLFWEPGWQRAKTETFRGRVAEALAVDGWVTCGNYTSSAQDIIWGRADTVVWLDLPLPLMMQRTLRRTLRRARRREVLWGTNVERLNGFFSRRDNLIRFSILHHRTKRPLFDAAMRDPRWSHITFHHLRSRREVRDFLSS